MRVLVCGGRNYKDKTFLWNILDGLGPPEVSCIISGMARGADSFAAEWAERFGFPLEKFYPDWEKYGKSAGFRRNTEMLVEGQPDLVIAFPGGKGTAMMVRIAKEAGVPVKEIRYDNQD